MQIQQTVPERVSASLLVAGRDAKEVGDIFADSLEMYSGDVDVASAMATAAYRVYLLGLQDGIAMMQ